jgi:hypothetical protein
MEDEHLGAGIRVEIHADVWQPAYGRVIDHVLPDALPVSDVFTSHSFSLYRKEAGYLFVATDNAGFVKYTIAPKDRRRWLARLGQLNHVRALHRFHTWAYIHGM